MSDRRIFPFGFLRGALLSKLSDRGLAVVQPDAPVDGLHLVAVS